MGKCRGHNTIAKKKFKILPFLLQNIVFQRHNNRKISIFSKGIVSKVKGFSKYRKEKKEKKMIIQARPWGYRNALGFWKG